MYSEFSKLKKYIHVIRVVLSYLNYCVCQVVEGYGQTECTAPITLSIQGDMNTEHVGPPIACNLVKLADVPEMEYYATSNQGEICVKGSNIFQGYFKDPDAVSFDDHGWHHTGDIGMWLSVSVTSILKTISYLSYTLSIHIHL